MWQQSENVVQPSGLCTSGTEPGPLGADTGDERTIFPMMPIESIRRLKELHEELDFLNDCSADGFTTDIRREGLGQPSGSE
jgi:hypothetical protein